MQISIDLRGDNSAFLSSLIVAYYNPQALGPAIKDKIYHRKIWDKIPRVTLRVSGMGIVLISKIDTMGGEQSLIQIVFTMDPGEVSISPKFLTHLYNKLCGLPLDIQLGRTHHLDMNPQDLKDKHYKPDIKLAYRVPGLVVHILKKRGIGREKGGLFVVPLDCAPVLPPPW
jgi:hypothetical protein